MSLGTSRLIVTCAIFAILAVAIAAFTPAANRAHAQVDIAGEWDVAISGAFTATCHVIFSPSDASADAVLDCRGFGVGDFSGTYDAASGNFGLSGTLPVSGIRVPIEFSGALSEDGGEISGSWTALGSFTGTFLGSRAEDVAPTIDLGGSWLVEFVAGRPDSCVAVIEQSGSDLLLALECEQSGVSTLTGTITPTGLRLEGVALGRAVRIVAAFAPGGDAFGGDWRSSESGGTGIVLAVRTSGPFAQLDVTGRWSAQLGGAFPITCDVAMSQTGAELFSVNDCSFLGEFTASGSVDSETGTFRLTGGVEVLAVVSEDGSLATGAWARPSSDYSGLLTARKTGDEPGLIDLTGPWRLVLRGDIVSECEAELVQASTDLSANVTCNRLGSGELEGFASLLSGRFRLRGPVGDREISLEGRVAEDRLSVIGEWYLLREDDERFPFASLGEFGCFAITPIDTGLGDCEPPPHHPSVIVETAFPVDPAQLEAIRKEFAKQDLNASPALAGLAGLGVAFLALGMWRVRLRR